MSRRILAAILVGLAVLAGGTISAGANEDIDAVYKLGAGDRVKITVFGEKDLSGEFEVSASGIIAFPLIGDVRAADHTLSDLERRLAEKLGDGFLKSPRVNAEVVNYRPFFILGEVRRPGSYPYASGMKVITAVALGGGFTYRARENSITIKRAADPTGKEVPVTDEDLVLPGDVIRVPERFF